MSNKNKNKKAKLEKQKAPKLINEIESLPTHEISIKSSSYIKRTFDYLSYVINIIFILLLFQPQISPYLFLPENSKNPFETFLTISNNGHFDIINVKCELSDGLRWSADIKEALHLYKFDPNDKIDANTRTRDAFGPGPPIHIDRIKSHHSETIDLRKLFGLIIPERATAAQFSINITFSVWYYPKQITNSYHYKLFKTVTGAYSWAETSN